jgi:hypothetical protein
MGILVAMPLLGFSLAACSASSGDYRREAEKYLESDDLAKEAGYRFDSAVCEEPSTDDVGVQFACTATDNDGDDWEFIVEITGSRAITVISGEVVG